MSDPIRSISQNNYLLSNGGGGHEYSGTNGVYVDNVNEVIGLDTSASNAIETVIENSGAWGGAGLPISAGPGIDMSISNDILQIGSKYNEDVLWEGNKALTAMSSSANAISLSGSLYDYEMVSVYGRPLDTHEEMKVIEFAPDSASEGFDWLTWFKGGGTTTAGAIRFGCAFMQHSENKIWVKTNELFQLSLASTGISMATNQNIITKVIGINRKST